MNNPLVSISCITYNHASFLRQCLEGFLMQKTDFDFEVVIHDDASTDGTKEIIEEYTMQYPDIFFPLYQIENQYSKGVRGIMARYNFPRCRGKYIALCEGDDYWTDSLKLQKQIDFLEANPDYVLSFHKIKILKSNGELVDDFITKVPENYETIETLAQLGNYIHTPSVVFRNVIQEFPPEFALSPIGDFFLYMLLAEKGRLKYLQQEMAVYRDGVGIWSAQSDYFRNLKTAQTHSLIVSALSKRLSITNTLINRIINFLDRFESEIKPSDLVQLNTCPLIEEAFYTTLQKNKKQISVSAVDSYTTMQLLKIILRRIKKRIWKLSNL